MTALDKIHKKIVYRAWKGAKDKLSKHLCTSPFQYNVTAAGHPHPSDPVQVSFARTLVTQCGSVNSCYLLHLLLQQQMVHCID